MAQVVEQLSRKCEALSSIPSTAKKFHKTHKKVSPWPEVPSSLGEEGGRWEQMVTGDLQE
jgi:hypothetical protein